MKVVRDMSITEADLVFKRRRGLHSIVKSIYDIDWSDEAALYELETGHRNYGEFPDEVSDHDSKVPDVNAVDMSDVEKL